MMSTKKELKLNETKTKQKNKFQRLQSCAICATTTSLYVPFQRSIYLHVVDVEAKAFSLAPPHATKAPQSNTARPVLFAQNSLRILNVCYNIEWRMIYIYSLYCYHGPFQKSFEEVHQA